MPSLLRLSNEILLHIASYFKYHGDINSFMQITGRLYYLLRTHLYRHNIDHDDSSALQWAAERGMEPIVQRMLSQGAIPKTTKDTLRDTLIETLKNKHDGLVKLLLKHGIEDVINRNPQEWTYPACLDKKGRIDGNLLFIALGSGCESTLRVMTAHKLKEGRAGRVASGGDLTIEGFFTEHLPLLVNCRNRRDRTPLIDAVRKENPEAIRFLLNAGADPNGFNIYEVTALQVARRNRYIEGVRLLLENNACPEKLWLEWYQELRSLSNEDTKKWDVEMASLLLKHSNMESKMAGDTVDWEMDWDMLLFTATTCGYTPVVQQILERGSHGDTSPWGSRTFLPDWRTLPLTTAVEWGYMDMIALMLDYGAAPAPHMEKRSCTSPFHAAILRDRVDIVEMLMDRGVGINVHRRKDHDPLKVDVLSRTIRSPSMFQLFLDRGILNLNNPSTPGALMVNAMESKNVALLQILHDKGIPLKMPFRRNEHKAVGTLEAAIWEGSQIVVEYLLSQGVNPNSGWCLEEAAYAKDFETTSTMIDLLLHHGANINAMKASCILGSCTGEYCVCNRSEDWQLKVVQLLLDRGVNPLPESSTWARNTLSRSAKKKHTKVIRLLLQAMNDTHGVSLDDVQRNLRFLEEHWEFRTVMKRFLEDCYWRKKYPVP